MKLGGLFSGQRSQLLPRSSSLVRTDVGFAIPKGYFGKTYAHSIWAKRFTGVGGRAIDSDYRGGVLVIFCNYSDDWIQINKEEKVVVFILKKLKILKIKQNMVWEILAHQIGNIKHKHKNTKC